MIPHLPLAPNVCPSLFLPDVPVQGAERGGGSQGLAICAGQRPARLPHLPRRRGAAGVPCRQPASFCVHPCCAQPCKLLLCLHGPVCSPRSQAALLLLCALLAMAAAHLQRCTPTCLTQWQPSRAPQEPEVQGRLQQWSTAQAQRRQQLLSGLPDERRVHGGAEPLPCCCGSCVIPSLGQGQSPTMQQVRWGVCMLGLRMWMATSTFRRQARTQCSAPRRYSSSGEIGGQCCCCSQSALLPSAAHSPVSRTATCLASPRPCPGA